MSTYVGLVELVEGRIEHSPALLVAIFVLHDDADVEILQDGAVAQLKRSDELSRIYEVVGCRVWRRRGDE